MIKSVAEPAVRKGHYATKQIFCRDQVIAWSHRRRFEVGLELARRFAGQQLLDYGCGDGTFLALLQTTPHRPALAVGAELEGFQLDDCRARLGDKGLQFVAIEQLDRPAQHGRYDGIVCMEVLEHVVEIDVVLRRLWRLLSEEGVLLISVPVEIGLPLLVKQTARRIAGWRGIGDYPGTAPYTLREYFAAVFAGPRQHLTRPVYGRESALPFHDHKGFNWIALRDRLHRWFVIERTVASPLPWLGPHLATQVWFVARKRDLGGRHP